MINKLMIAICLLVAVVYCDDERLQKALDNLPEDKIPAYFKLPRDDNSHWCCKVDVPILTLSQTRVASFSFVDSGKHKCGYYSCGFLGFGSCTRWCTSYWTTIAYYVDHFTVTQAQPCPETQVACCVNYLNILGHCFHLDEIKENLELLNILNQQGIVLPDIGK